MKSIEIELSKQWMHDTIFNRLFHNCRTENMSTRGSTAVATDSTGAVAADDDDGERHRGINTGAPMGGNLIENEKSLWPFSKYNE